MKEKKTKIEGKAKKDLDVLLDILSYGVDDMMGALGEAYALSCYTSKHKIEPEVVCEYKRKHMKPHKIKNPNEKEEREGKLK